MPIETADDPRRTYPAAAPAKLAWCLVQDLQHRLVTTLEEAAAPHDDPGFRAIDWLRDGGRHGGGRRYATALSPVFDRASINVSTVHYDDLPEKRLSSATALSAIIHPHHPQAPSVHTHISWTQMRDGAGYWRLMADLNPSLNAPDFTSRFDMMLADVAGDRFEEGKAQGKRYFYIPALDRHRGSSHFYLEGYKTDDEAADLRLARNFGEAVIDCYGEIFRDALTASTAPTNEERVAQLAYHTIYFFQVLTLDRGTTSGVLVHDQNDVGILASLPSFIDAELLASWAPELPTPQDQLLASLLQALPDEHPCPVTDETRARLAKVVRSHYQAHPEALALQARGDIIPPTVQNHETTESAATSD